MYKLLANKTLDWLPMDTKELYEKNLKNRYNDLVKYNWINNHFTYKMNSLGFRCEEFNDQPSIMFLGCSLTCGIGIPAEARWSELVSKELNLQHVNLGIGGGSSDLAFRLCVGYVDKIKPKIIIFMVPPGIRIELLFSTYILSLKTGDEQNSYYKQWASDENNHYFNLMKNKYAIEKMCSDRGIKLLIIDDFQPILPIFVSLARDLTHPGIESNRICADKVLSLL